MTTPSEYVAAKSAVRQALKADIAKDVPWYLQSNITDDMINQLANDLSKAALDAAAEVRNLATKL